MTSIPLPPKSVASCAAIKSSGSLGVHDGWGTDEEERVERAE